MSIFNFWKPKVVVKKFTEPLSTPVFTTKFVIQQNKDIIYVTHHEGDGAWEFFSDDEVDDVSTAVMTVGLGDIIAHDDSVLELCNMPQGHFAIRDKKGDEWVVNKI